MVRMAKPFLTARSLSFPSVLLSREHDRYLTLLMQFLFTAGMTLVDCLDSVLMLFAYAAPDQGTGMFKWSVIEDKDTKQRHMEQPGALGALEPELQCPELTRTAATALETVEVDDGDNKNDLLTGGTSTAAYVSTSGPQARAETAKPNDHKQSRAQRMIRNKGQMISSLSISLTLLSILVALRSASTLSCVFEWRTPSPDTSCSISLIEIMGLIEDNCSPCQAAASDPNGGGLAGGWWRFWSKVCRYRLSFTSLQLTQLAGERRFWLCWCCDCWMLRGDFSLLVSLQMGSPAISQRPGSAMRSL